jgi:hypothetical protein
MSIAKNIESNLVRILIKETLEEIDFEIAEALIEN